MNVDRLWRPVDIIGCHLFGRMFVGAQSIDDVLLMGESLIGQGYRVTYNLLGEHEKNVDIVDKASEAMNLLIKKIGSKSKGNISCKPTLFGLAISKDLFRDKIRPIIEACREAGIEVEFDAENYEYIHDTFEVFSCFASVPDFRNSVRQAVQAHLKDIIPLMDTYSLWSKKLRIVKGSGVYDEADEICENSEAKIRQNYFYILRRNISNLSTPFTATIRDRNLAESVAKITGDGEFSFEFQMLYGPLGRKLAKELLSKGYKVRIYLPFVVDWCHDVWKPYGIRRAQMLRRIIIKSLLNKS